MSEDLAALVRRCSGAKEVSEVRRVEGYYPREDGNRIHFVAEIHDYGVDTDLDRFSVIVRDLDKPQEGAPMSGDGATLETALSTVQWDRLARD